MTENHDQRLAISAVRARYSDPTAYIMTDSWHDHTGEEVRREILRSWKALPTGPEHVILNAGAGDNDLGLCPPATINLDISEAGVLSLHNPLVASIEDIPLEDGSVDTVICVGSVINYCDAAAAIVEFGRVLRLGGYLILEFESSYSAELFTQDSFGQSATVVESFYADQMEVVWAYSPTYIYNLLHAAKFKVKRSVPVHVLSPWALLFLHNVRVAASIAHLDRVVRGLPFLTRWASNHLLFCEKQT
jgi:SAM-dependent methyltransferase